jgi:hypothetical protein
LAENDLTGVPPGGRFLIYDRGGNPPSVNPFLDSVISVSHFIWESGVNREVRGGGENQGDILIVRVG